MEVDNRLVQTAVLGGAMRDSPVVMPFGPVEAERFRNQYKPQGFWCGELLGGCGRQLVAKVCHDKVCHFAHYPNTPECGRRNGDRKSADHLYMARALRKVLGIGADADDRRTRYVFDSGRGPAEGAVCTGVTIKRGRPDKKGVIVVQLGRMDREAWNHADTELRASAEWVTWLFSEGNPAAVAAIERDGYALRIKCDDDDGGGRRVRIGTENLMRELQWLPVEKCTMSSTGFRTPAMPDALQPGAGPEQVEALPPAAAFPLDTSRLVLDVRPGASVTEVAESATEPAAFIVSGMMTGPQGSMLGEAEIRLSAEPRIGPEGTLYRLRGAASLVIAPEDGVEPGPWIIRADRIGLLRKAGPVLKPSLAAGSGRAPRIETDGDRRPALPRDGADAYPAPPEHPAAFDFKAGVERLREFLIAVAQRKTRTTWGEIEAAFPDFPRLHESRRYSMLAAADLRSRPESPLFVLVSDAKGHYRRLFGELRIPIAMGRHALEQRVDASLTKTYAKYTPPTNQPKPPTKRAKKPAPVRAVHSAPADDVPPARTEQAPVDVTDYVTRLRAILVGVARSTGLITWTEISRRIPELAQLRVGEQADLLHRVDAVAEANEPLLSHLIVTGRRDAHPLYPDTMRRSGPEVVTDQDERRSQRAQEVLKVHSYWRNR